MKVFLIIFMLLTTPLYAQEMGRKATDFTLNTLDHGRLSLSDYKGKIIFIFFYYSF